MTRFRGLRCLWGVETLPEDDIYDSRGRSEHGVEDRRTTLRLGVTSAHTTVSGYHTSDLPHRLSLADGDPVRLRGEPRLTLDVTEQYRAYENTDGWRVAILG